MMQVLSVASEAFPLIKTGGLADVAGALPAALSPHASTITTLLPGYPAVLAALKNAQTVHTYADLLGSEARILASSLGEHPLLVLDAPSLFSRGGGPYQDAGGKDWSDNWQRFAALGRAGADVASGLAGGHRFDLLHAHDWQAAMAPVYLRYAARSHPPSLFTIHNIAFQGRFDVSVFQHLGLPAAAFALDGLEYYGGVSYLKGGLTSADAISTVSPGYAQEIQTPQYGMGLDGVIRARSGVVYGIVNGIDSHVWNPQNDPFLASRYDVRKLQQRSINKRAVLDRFNLTAGEGPLFAVVSRLTWQKGMDILAAQLDALAGLGCQAIVLGSGDAALESDFLKLAKRHPDNIAAEIGYDESLAHLLQGGADAILIPSRFEPCGLTQLYGLAYGCVPVATRTGGLGDTIIDANEAALEAGAATGILFQDATPGGLKHGLDRAAALYRMPAIWRRLQRQGMKADFSWHRIGGQYAAFYASLTKPGAKIVPAIAADRMTPDTAA